MLFAGSGNPRARPSWIRERDAGHQIMAPARRHHRFASPLACPAYVWTGSAGACRVYRAPGGDLT